jgi:hypothetical protein
MTCRFDDSAPCSPKFVRITLPMRTPSVPKAATEPRIAFGVCGNFGKGAGGSGDLLELPIGDRRAVDAKSADPMDGRFF